MFMQLDLVIPIILTSQILRFTQSLKNQIKTLSLIALFLI